MDDRSEYLNVLLQTIGNDCGTKVNARMLTLVRLFMLGSGEDSLFSPFYEENSSADWRESGRDHDRDWYQAIAPRRPRLSKTTITQTKQETLLQRCPHHSMKYTTSSI